MRAYPWNEDRNAQVIKLLTEDKLPPKQVARQVEITVENVYWIKRTYGPRLMGPKIRGKSFFRMSFTKTARFSLGKQNLSKPLQILSLKVS